MQLVKNMQIYIYKYKRPSLNVICNFYDRGNAVYVHRVLSADGLEVSMSILYSFVHVSQFSSYI